MKALLEFKINFNIHFEVDDQGKIIFNKPDQKIVVSQETVMPGFALNQLKCRASYDSRVEEIVKQGSYVLSKKVDLESIKPEHLRLANQQQQQNNNNQNTNRSRQNQQQRQQQTQNQRNVNEQEQDNEEEEQDQEGDSPYQPHHRRRDIVPEFAGLSYEVTGKEIIASIPFEVNNDDKEVSTHMTPKMVTEKERNIKNISININNNDVSSDQAVEFLNYIIPYVYIKIRFKEKIKISQRKEKQEADNL